MTRLPQPMVPGSFAWSEGRDRPFPISLANASPPPPARPLLPPHIGSYDKRRGVNSGHEPLFPMTAKGAGNFSCAATRNDCNVSADAGMSCCSPISSWWQERQRQTLLQRLWFLFWLVLQPVLHRCAAASHDVWKPQFRSPDAKERERGSTRGSLKKVLWWEIPELGVLHGERGWGRLLGRPKASVGGCVGCVCVCVCMCVWACVRVTTHGFSGMAGRQAAAQYGVDFVAHSTAASDIVLWQHTRLGTHRHTQLPHLPKYLWFF